MPGTEPADRRPRRRRGRGGHPGRRRHRRGHRHRRRVGHHRRVRPGDPRVGRRPQLGHRRDDRAVRPDRRADHHQARRVVRRPDDRAGRGRGAAEDAERDRADDPPGRSDDHLPARRRRAAAHGRLLRRAAVPGGADGAAGLSHPDDHRRAALGHRHRRHGPARAAQRAGDLWPGRRGRGRRRHPAARQDGHDHLRQPAGHRTDPGARRVGGGAGRGGAAVQPGRPDARRPQHRRAVRRRARPPIGGDTGRGARRVRPVHGPDQDVRARSRRAHPSARVPGPPSPPGSGPAACPPRSRRPSTASASRAGRRWSSPRSSGALPGSWASSSSPTSSSPEWPSGSRRCGRWASGR